MNMRRGSLRFLTAMLLLGSTVRAGDGVPSVGKWLEVMKDNGAVMRWQASDLTYDLHHKCLWAIADQNGAANLKDGKRIGPAKHVFWIDIPTNAVKSAAARPIEIEFDPKEFEAVKAIIPPDEWARGLDFEGFVAVPATLNMFYACTEGTYPLLLRLEYVEAKGEKKETMKVKHITRISRRDNRDDSDDHDINSRWEGLTINHEGTRLFLASQRPASDSRPRIYTLLVKDFVGKASLQADPHSEVEPMALKDVRLPGATISALQYVPPNSLDKTHPGFLLALNRNPLEKVYIIDLAYLRYEPRVVMLDLHAPGAQDGTKFKTKGMSPEGLAVDVETNRAWLINDPLAQYYAVPAGAGDGRFKNEVPMLFDLELKHFVP